MGIDDTDSRAGGCTTALARLVPPLFPELREAAPPRLVRLNPNVPWKTRGNGAIAIAMTGTIDAEEALERVRALVQAHARRDEGTSPGVVVSDRPLPAWLYEAAVTRIVERDELPLGDAAWWGGRGVIGAAAALAWPAEPPPRDARLVSPLRGSSATWERIAYRDRPGPRDISPERVRDVELSFPTLFDSYDLVEDDVVCVPSSPCPVLWGLRGTDPADLARASAMLGPQRPAAETLFVTNHASDDHLVPREAGDVQAFESPIVRGRVGARPVERGGHVFVEVDGLRCAAYAPTRSFRRVVAALREGDDITVCGGAHVHDGRGQVAARRRDGAHAGPDGRVTVGIEKLCVHEARRKLGNPTCPTCGRAMRSAGRNAGYRCCGNRTGDATWAHVGPRGWIEVPASARRHLARPLKLGVRPDLAREVVAA